MTITGCLSSNEDPTNIELEVLRASLLEKQLTIDELRATIDEYVITTNEHLNEIEQLNNKLETETSIRKRIASESNKLLRINTDAQHFYEIDHTKVFMINNYTDTENAFSLEKLYLYENGSLPQLMYTAENIEFDLHRSEKQIIIATNEALIFQDYKTTVLQNLVLNSHNDQAQLHFFSDNYIESDKPEKSLSIIAAVSEEEKSQLNGIYTVNYSDLDEIDILFHEFNSSDYYIDEKNNAVYYSTIEEEEKNVLYAYNLETKQRNIIATNMNLPFKLYKKDNQVYYYSEEIESEKSITLLE